MSRGSFHCENIQLLQSTMNDLAKINLYKTPSIQLTLHICFWCFQLSNSLTILSHYTILYRRRPVFLPITFWDCVFLCIILKKYTTFMHIYYEINDN